MSEPRWLAQCFTCGWQVRDDDGAAVDNQAEIHLADTGHVVSIAIGLNVKNRVPLKGIPFEALGGE